MLLLVAMTIHGVIRGSLFLGLRLSSVMLFSNTPPLQECILDAKIRGVESSFRRSLTPCPVFAVRLPFHLKLKGGDEGQDVYQLLQERFKSGPFSTVP